MYNYKLDLYKSNLILYIPEAELKRDITTKKLQS